MSTTYSLAGGGGGACKQHGQCGNTGPWVTFCCPDGFTCQPAGQSYRIWSCKADITDQAPVPDALELLAYPPRPLPPGACTCRVNAEGERVAMGCPSPWDHPAGTKQVGGGVP